jgi:hypothetical protein
MRTGVLFAPSRVAVQHTDIAQLTSTYATDVLRLCKSLQQLRKHAANALIRDLERSDTVFARAHHRQHNHSRGQDGWARARKSGQHGGSRALAYECMHADGALRCWRTVHDAAAHSACARESNVVSGHRCALAHSGSCHGASTGTTHHHSPVFFPLGTCTASTPFQLQRVTWPTARVFTSGGAAVHATRPPASTRCLK